MTTETFKTGDRVRYLEPDEYGEQGYIFGTVESLPGTYGIVQNPIMVAFDDGETVVESPGTITKAEPCTAGCENGRVPRLYGSNTCPECYGSGCKGAQPVPPYGDAGGPF